MARGIVLPKAMRYNVDHAANKLAMAAQALGVDTARMTDHDAALAAADAVEGLIRRHLSLSSLGQGLKEALVDAATTDGQTSQTAVNAGPKTAAPTLRVHAEAQPGCE